MSESVDNIQKCDHLKGRKSYSVTIHTFLLRVVLFIVYCVYTSRIILYSILMLIILNLICVVVVFLIACIKFSQRQ